MTRLLIPAFIEEGLLYPPEAHESFISRKTVAVVPLTELSFILGRFEIDHYDASHHGKGPA